MMINYTICSITGKRTYRDRLDALIAMSNITAHNHQQPHRAYHRTPCRVYQCPYCQGWHLTSQTLTERRQRYHRIVSTPTSFATLLNQSEVSLCSIPSSSLSDPIA